MKKLIATALGVMALTASAQNDIFDNPDNKAYFGVRAGLDISAPGDLKLNNLKIDGFKPGAGFNVGAIYNIPVVANFYVEPGIGLFYSTFGVKDEYLENIEGGIKYDKAYINTFGMRIPVMAGYHFDFTSDMKIRVFTGPEFEIGFSSNQHVKADGLDVSESMYGEDGTMRRFNFLWGFGAGVDYGHYYLGISGGIGLTNLFKDDWGIEFQQSHVSISLGYNF